MLGREADPESLQSSLSALKVGGLDRRVVLENVFRSNEHLEYTSTQLPMPFFID